MNFAHFEYWPGLLLAFVVFAVMVILLEGRFFRLVKLYWFRSRSLMSYVSSFLFLAGMGALIFSLLDPRGPEEKIKMEVPKDRTIILLDTSASMLAEDIKPSRLQKAVLIAKHFARKAAGHQLSIVAFAEIQKKIVPFTNDIDLIDARLDSLKGLRNQYGSSALSMAIQESIQYFQEQGEARGNILVLTDGEETTEGIDFKVPKEVHVALVGIGTSQGGRIPMDDGRGFRFGYKKDRGQDVISKLHEEFFKKAASDIPSAKYWLANSYTLPSDEIIEFFNSEKSKGEGQQDMVIRPVLMEWIVIPGIILIILSQLLKFVRVFALICLVSLGSAYAQEDEEIKLSPETISKMESLRAGKLNKLEKVKLADEMYQSGLKPEAMTLYQENLDPKKIDPSIPPEAYMNYGTAQLESGKVQDALDTYDRVLKSQPSGSAKSQELKGLMEKNIVSHFRQQEQKKKKEQDKKNKKQDQNKDSQNQSGEGQSSQGQSNKPQQNKNQSGKQDKPNPSQGDQKDKDKDKNKDKDNKGEEDKKDKDDEGEDQEKKDKKDDPQDGQEEKKPLPPAKLPAKLKQLMSDDRQLQMKMIENDTRDLNKRKSRKSKDW